MNVCQENFSAETEMSKIDTWPELERLPDFRFRSRPHRGRRTHRKAAATSKASSKNFFATKL
jgi:hypothetical protein